MRNYVLYIKKCPGIENPRHFKIGKAALDRTRTRLASYQNAVGPVWQEQFLRVFVGEDIDVNEAEKKIKLHFKPKISSAEAGFSEWISDIDMDALLDFIKELREEHFIKLIDPPAEYQPLTMSLCEDLELWYLEYLKTVEGYAKD
jgi:hypothetical protein